MSTAIEPVASLESKSTDLVTRASHLVIENAQDAEIVVALGREIGTVEKLVKNYWDDPATGPCSLAHNAWKGAVSKRDEMLKPLAKAKAASKSTLLAWQREQERIANEAQRKIDEAARLDREAEIRKANALARKQGVDTDDRKDMRKQMRAAPIMTPTVAPPEKPKGMSTPKRWKAALEGSTEQEQAKALWSLIVEIGRTKGQIPLSLVKFDQTAANAWAKSTKGTVKVPGLRIYQDEGVRF